MYVFILRPNKAILIGNDSSVAIYHRELQKIG